MHYIEVSVAGVGTTPHGNVVLLLDPSKRRAVPVFVGESEALSIELRLAHKSYSRPLTHDLLESLLHVLGGEISEVRVERLENNAYAATLVVIRESSRYELDARTSDAIALALGSQAPIMMAEEVLESAGVELDHLPSPHEVDGVRSHQGKGVSL